MPARPRRFRLPRLSTRSRQLWAVSAAVVAAPVAEAEPAGSDLLDVAWQSGIAGLLAYTASTAKRGPLLVAATLAVASSRTILAVLLAIVAVVCAAGSTLRLHRRALLLRGLAGGATGISLMASSMERPGWLTAIASVVIAGPILVSGGRNASKPARQVLAFGAIVGVLFVAAASIGAAIGVAGNASRIDRGTVALEQGLAAARAGDAATAAARLQGAQLLLEAAGRGIDRWGMAARVVPFVGQHVRAVTDILGDVEAASDQAGRTASLASGDTLAVRAGGMDLQAIGELEHPFRRLASLLDEVAREVDHHVSGPLLPPLRDRLDRLGREARTAASQASITSQAAAVAPELLGADQPRRYLVLFTSPAEARGRFGFPGSFAEVTFTDGRLVLGEHGSTSSAFRSVEANQAGFDVRDDQVEPYLSYGPTQTMLSATIPPDFPTVARLAAELWAQSGRERVDGVLRFDPAALAPLLAFTGPVVTRDVPEPLTALNLERFLLFDQYVQFPQSQAPRRELLETVSEVTFERLQATDLPPPRVLVDLFGPLVRQGHLEVASFHRDAGAFLDRIGLQGRFEPPSGDSLLVTNVNITGNKIDSFLTRTVRYDASVDDGQLEGTISVELRNGAPARNLPFYVIGSATKPVLPLGTNRTSLLVYTTVPVTEVLVDGVARPVRSERTAGRWVHQLVVELGPGATSTVVLRVAGQVPEPYALLVEPGLGATPDEYAVEVDLGGGRPLTYRGRVTTGTSVR